MVSQRTRFEGSPNRGTGAPTTAAPSPTRQNCGVSVAPYAGNVVDPSEDHRYRPTYRGIEKASHGLHGPFWHRATTDASTPPSRTPVALTRIPRPEIFPLVFVNETR